jgi:hypothetical protein
MLPPTQLGLDHRKYAGSAGIQMYVTDAATVS